MNVQHADLSEDEELDLILQHLDKLEEERARDHAETKRFLTSILEKMRSVTVKSNVLTTSEMDMDLDFGDMFPIKTISAMDMLETSLRTDKPFRSKLAIKLRRLGGRDGKTMARHMVKFMFSDEMNVQYSWVGMGTKTSFSKNKELLNFMLSLIREKERDYTENDLAHYFKDYLKHANSRITRRIESPRRMTVILENASSVAGTSNAQQPEMHIENVQLTEMDFEIGEQTEIDIDNEEQTEMDMELDVGDVFPIKTQIAMGMLETSLRTDKTLRPILANQIRDIVGRDGRTTARKMAKFMFSDVMNVQYSWHGTFTKSPFKENKEVMDLMLSVIRETDNGFTETDLFSLIKDHLKHASARMDMKKWKETDPSMQPAKCPHCDRVAKTPGILAEHLKMHADERPFLCDQCARTFTRQDLLNSHMQTHTHTVKNLACSLCDQKYCTTAGLTHHMVRTHKHKPRRIRKQIPKPAEL